MPKRARESNSSVSRGKDKESKKPRRGYTTVARTRGVYATGEMKYFDTQRNYVLTASSDWTGTEADPATYNTLVVPIKGAGISERIGRVIHVHAIKIKATFTTLVSTAGTGVQPPSIRVALVQDTQTNSTQMQGEQVFEDSGGAIDNLGSFQNINNFGRFKVLKDEIFNMPDPSISYNGTNTDINGTMLSFKWTHKFKKPVLIHFNATNGGTIADIIDNSFHLLAITNTIALTPVFNYVCRVTYKDPQ